MPAPQLEGDALVAVRHRGSHGTVGKRRPATVLRFQALLRAAFAQGVRWGLIDRNPTDRATPPRVNRPEIAPPAVDDVLA
ncbi:MAG: hypothetical protein HYX34_03960 [Actinobacteria bacterium]|nr:hypothetical protein [Actinomycetota bacterium]